MFDFNNVEISNGNQYLSPGKYLVKVIEVKSGKSSQKGTPFVEVIVADKTGATATKQWYLSTSVKEGSTKSAMDISAQEIVQIVAAANNLDMNTEEGKNAAKAKLGSFASEQDMLDKLPTRLAILLVDKEFALKLNGKWVNPTDTSKKPWIKAEFAGGKFAVPVNKFADLREYDAARDLKGTPATTETVNPVSTGNMSWD